MSEKGDFESPVDSETSHSMLQQLRSSDAQQAWRWMEQVYAPLIRNWLRRSGVRLDEEDDLVQEVLIQVSRLLPDFQVSGQPGAFRSWLRRVTINSMRNYLRKRGHRRESRGGTSFEAFLHQCADPNSEVSRNWEEEHQQAMLERVLQMAQHQFQPSTWQAFVETALLGNSAEAAARKLGMSRSAVHTARSRVLAAVRRIGRGLLDE